MDSIFKKHPEWENALIDLYKKYTLTIKDIDIKNEDKDKILLEYFSMDTEDLVYFKLFLLYHTSNGNLKIPVYNIKEWIEITTYEKDSYNVGNNIHFHIGIIKFYLTDLKEIIGVDLITHLMGEYIKDTTMNKNVLINKFHQKTLVELGIIEVEDTYYKFTELGIFTYLVKLYGVDNIESNYSKGKINKLVEQYEKNKKEYCFERMYLM